MLIFNFKFCYKYKSVSFHYGFKFRMPTIFIPTFQLLENNEYLIKKSLVFVTLRSNRFRKDYKYSIRFLIYFTIFTTLTTVNFCKRESAKIL